jgi:hypothetical protein
LRTGLLSALAMCGVLTSWGARAEAQALTSPTAPGLRIEWTVDSAGGRWRPVCGYIYNDTPVALREVRLLVEGRDTSDRVIDSRIAAVLGYIAPRGRTYFCSTATAAAARYSVAIVGADWGSDR